MSKKKKYKPGIYAKVNATYDSLFPAEKKVADFLLANSDKIETLTTQEMAEATKTSKAAVTRFCQRLGYQGFKEFKVSAIKDQVLGIGNVNSEFSEEDTEEALIAKMCESNAVACRDTALILDEKSLSQVAKLLLDRPVFLFGDGAAGPVVGDFYQKMLRAGLICNYSPDRRFQDIQSELVKKDDVVLIFDLAGSSKNVVEIMERAKEKGAVTVAICNVIGSPLAKAADINLFGPGRTTSDITGTFAPRIALLCIVDCLFMMMIKYSENRFSKELKETMQAVVRDWI